MSRILKSDTSSSAGVVVSENAVRTTVNEENGVTVAENGVTISGPISLVSSPKHIRLGGLWTFNDPFKMTLPSTYATPTATLVVDPPVKQFKTIMQDSIVMLGLLSAISGI